MRLAPRARSPRGVAALSLPAGSTYAGARDAVRTHVSCGAAHGPIATWDVSTVTDMRELLRYIPCGYEFNEDIDAWDVGQVTTMEARRAAPARLPRRRHAHRPPHQASGC